MKKIQLISSIILSTALLASCGNEKAPEQGAQGPMRFRVFSVSEQTTRLFTDYPASIQGEQDIEIRPKIDGYIDAVLITEGQTVKKGQVLFKISNPMYEQSMRNAAAAVELAQSDVENAQLQLSRTKPLVEKGIVGDYEFETAKITLKAKQALLMQARANLSNAATNVGYTTIKSPFDGVIGTLNFKLGSYVNSTTTLPLTTVSNIRKVYAYFSLNEKEQLTFFRNTTGKNLEDKIHQLPAVRLLLSDGSEYEQTGTIETFSGVVSSQTGSFNVRAGFPNPQLLLRSGNSGKIRLTSSVQNALLIPQNATYELQGKRFVYVLQKDQSVKATEISIREVPGGKLFIVDQGLQNGETIVTEGIPMLTDGMKIVPVKINGSEVIKQATAVSGN